MRLYFTPPMQSAYSIVVENRHLIELLEKKYGRYLTRRKTIATQHIMVLQDRTMFTLSTNHGIIQTTDPLNKVDRYIVDHTSYDKRIFALHGAAVEWNSKCYLFLASTYSGKTTLTSYLTSHGFGYITDDCVLLDRTSFNVHPYTTPIHLRSGGLKILQECNCVPQNLQELKWKENDPFCRFVYTPFNCVNAPLPLERIFFIERNDTMNTVTEMNSLERIIALMKAPMISYEITDEYVKFISELAKTKCYCLRYCNMGYVKKIIQDEQMLKRNI